MATSAVNKSMEEVLGNPLCLALANIFMAKLESDVVRPFNPPFYDRCVDYCFLKTKKDKPDDVFERLNSCHPNIVFTVQEIPDHFLDTALTHDNQFDCKVYKKPGTLTTYWKTEISRKWN